jgi:DNA-directed RNA polymerase specialized sigma24 family protein
VRPPRWRALSWLTTTAIREAWRLERNTRRMCATDSTAIDTIRPREDAGVDELVIARLRLDLVSQLPERPRRFLLRLALGYSYREIAEAEHASYTTTSKQIARAKRLLRELEARDESGGENGVARP